MYKCKKLCLKIDGLVIFTVMQGHPVSTLIHDISFALLETGGRTAYLSTVSRDSGVGASAQLVPIGFKTHWCLSPPSGQCLPHSKNVANAT